jgi:MFS family permease
MTNFCGMPLSEIFFCEACCVIILVLLQIPTGTIADRWGRANSVKVGCFILLIELICFASATDRVLLWIGNALWAIGTSFVSGADSALIYDSLKENISDKNELERKYREIEGKSSAYRLTLTAIMCLMSGYLAEINMRLPIIIDAIIAFITLVVSFFFIETKRHSESEKDKLSYKNHMIGSIKYVFKKVHLLWIVSFAVLIGVTSKLWFFTYNPYFEMVNLPIHYYGYVFFALNIVAGLSSYYANNLANKIKEKWSIIFSISAITAPMIAMGLLVSKWSVSLVLFQNLVRGYLGPFMSNMLHKRIASTNRATVLSVKSAIYQAVEVVCMLSFGFVIHSISLAWAITYLGIVSTLIGIILVFVYMKLFKNNTEDTKYNGS